jgi:ferric-dicitrate binding protein FerR (iron transport regulator)
MPDTNAHIDELIAKVLAGDADKSDQARLQEWLDEQPANALYWEEMQRIWEGISAPPAETRFDTEAALKKVHQQAGISRGRMVRMRYWYAAAASVALLLVAWFWLQPAGTAPQTIASGDSPLQDTLQDGTKVWLNRKSDLMVLSGSDKKERRMRLSGEAYFDVETDSLKPFRVEVDQLEIEVLGTAFNVDNLTDTQAVVVTVTEGRVALRAAGKQLVLRNGEAARYTLTDQVIQRVDTTDPNALSYQTRNFFFEDTPLRVVIPRLEAVYGQVIVVRNPALLDCALNGSYTDLELDRILELIADSFSLELLEEDGVFVLNGAYCEE